MGVASQADMSSRIPFVVALLLTACQPEPPKPDYLPPDLRVAGPAALARPAGVLEAGQAAEADLCKDGRLFDAFLVHAFAGSEWAVDVETTNGLDPVVMLYGPWSKDGQWGAALAMDDDSGVDDNAALRGFVAPKTGEYLVLVGSYRGDGCGPYRVRARCVAGCTGPDGSTCPALSGCGEGPFCELGHTLDEAGCPTCDCLRPESECPCPEGYECSREGRCVNPLVCPEEEKVVCGVDGREYRNRCEAERRYGVEVANEGPCPRCPREPCELTCPFGFAQGEDGCPLCACRDRCESCPRVGQPVCGADGQTYPNACIAKACARVAIVAHHACSFECPDNSACDLACPAGLLRDDRDCPLCECRPEEEPCGCELPEDWQQPVCAADGVTYPSVCHARCAGATVVLRGACPQLRCQRHRDCPRGTVCLRPEEVCQDANQCPGACVMPEVRCGRVQVRPAEEGEDDRPDDASGEGGDPGNDDPDTGTGAQPEGQDPDGTAEVAADACPAGQECVEGTCRPLQGCHRLVDPVCAGGRDYLSACLARVAGAQVAHAGRCCPEECEHGCGPDAAGNPICLEPAPGGCDCPARNEPVCATSEDGERRTFDNACLARCHGWEVRAEHACEEVNTSRDDEGGR